MGRREEGEKKKALLASSVALESDRRVDVRPSLPVSPRSFAQRSCYNNRVEGFTSRLFSAIWTIIASMNVTFLRALGQKAVSRRERGLSIERISKETGNTIHFSKHTLYPQILKGRRFVSPLFFSPLEPGGISRHK